MYPETMPEMQQQVEEVRETSVWREKRRTSKYECTIYKYCPAEVSAIAFNYN